MVENQLKVAFVGPANVHETIQKMYSDWDLQVPLTSLQELDKEFSLDESEAKISKNTHAIVILSREYRKDPSLFADIIAFSAPYSVTCVLLHSNEKPIQHEIENAINKKKRDHSNMDEQYNYNTPVYFLDYNNFQEDLENALDNFVHSPIIDKDIKGTIKAIIDDGEGDLLEEDFEPVEGIDDVPEIEAPSDTDGKIITITANKGGVGKSTTCVALASAISLMSKKAYQEGKVEKPLKVAVLDLDERAGQLWVIVAGKQTTIYDIYKEGGVSVESLSLGTWTHEDTGVDYFFPPKNVQLARQLEPSFYVQLLTAMRKKYDVILCDTSAYLDDPMRKKVAYPMSDAILLISEMVKTSLINCLQWKKAHSPEGVEDERYIVPMHKVGLVINKAMKDVGLELSAIEKLSGGLPILAMIPSQPKYTSRAVNLSEVHTLLKVQVFHDAIRTIAESVLPDDVFSSLDPTIK